MSATTEARPVFTITNSTCADACWHAREEICRCSCGGANHGCLLVDGAEQPARTARIGGEMWRMEAAAEIGESSALVARAREINAAAGIDFLFAHSARQHWGYSPAAIIRPATKSARKGWSELAAWSESQSAVDILWVRC